MREVTINTTSFGTPPYDVYVCNVYGNNCILLSQLPSAPPPPFTLTLPSSFDTVPSVQIKIVSSDGCEIFHNVVCS